MDGQKAVIILSPTGNEKVRQSLERSGFKVSELRGNEIDKSASALIICDGGIRKPAFDKVEAIRSISDIPMITLSEDCCEIYRTVALAKGADMCMDINDLGSHELAARINALSRRYQTLPQKSCSGEMLTNGSISLDRRSREVWAEGCRVQMTATQFGIVEYLMENCGKVCSVEEIYSSVWRETPYSVHRTVVDHIRRIRGKIEPDPHHPSYIKAVFGVGYKMVKKECG